MTKCPLFQILLLAFFSFCLPGNTQNVDESIIEEVLENHPPLEPFINLLKYIPSTEENFSSTHTTGTTGQHSIVISGSSTTLDTIKIVFYTDLNCSSVAQTITMGNSSSPVSLAAGTWISTNASNYSLCQAFSYSSYSGCSGLLSAAQANAVLAMRYFFYYHGADTGSPSFTGCISNNGSTPNYQVPLNWDGGSPAACTSGSSCGYSQSISYNLQSTSYAHVIFTTGTSYDGNMGGFSGANTKCNSDSRKPASPSGILYRAFLQDNYATVSGVSYYQSASTSTLIATATGPNLAGWGSYITNIIEPSWTALVWTGFTPNMDPTISGQTDWTTNGYQGTQKSSCGNWTNNTTSYYGVATYNNNRTTYHTWNTDYPDHNSNWAINGSLQCIPSNASFLMCVAQ